MSQKKFVVGMTAGACLVLLVGGLFLLGLGGNGTSAASAPTAESTSATPENAKSPSGTPSAANNQGGRSALEQQMLNPISDAEWNAIANQLGLSVDELNADLVAGKTIAELGSSRNVTVQQVKDAMIAAGRAQVDAAVQAGTITQSDANALDQGLVVAIANKVTLANTAPVGTPGPEPSSEQIKAENEKKATQQDAGVRDMVTTAELNAAVQTLGITNEQFKQGASSTGTLGQYAATAHVTAQQVKDAMLTAGQTALDNAVHDGTISQSDADQLKQEIVQPLAEKIFQMITGGSQATPAT